jgi:acyl transferase domain-containing protein
MDSTVAIVGLAGRFPGAPDVDRLWANLVAGVESVDPVDTETLAANGVAESVSGDPRYVCRRGRLDDVEQFDAALFGYSRREAELIDPQQRVLLECAWQALHRAGLRGAGERVGVYVATGVNGYLRQNVLSTSTAEDVLGPLAVLVGNEKDHAATRIAYRLDLHGPAVTVQTACSSSLAAVHLAVQSLLRDECDAALAGAAAIALPQDVGYLFAEHDIMSPDGRCRAFDRTARGTNTGSGAAVVVLRRTADAIADGDTIYAVIRGSAMNNDGSRKVGYTAPSIQGQADVIRRALRAAGISADSVDYVEAHGTGTELGDAIEIASMTEAFRADTDRVAFCRIGSIKPNIGHLDAAAGIAGLVKATLALYHELIPPSINCADPNRELMGSPFVVATEAHPWPRSSRPRRCGVSSFGMGGTNIHVVLEEAPRPARPDGADGSRGPQLIALSANSGPALERLRDRLVEHLTQESTVDIADLSHTLRTGRVPLPHRLAVAATEVEGLRQRLSGASGRTGSPPRTIAFLFPGQGAQRAGMAAGLYADLDVFAAVVDECADRLRPELGFDLRDELCADRGDESVLDRTEATQPALFTVEYALARQLAMWGVTPTVLIGHSVGEYAAACLAGVFSLPDALAVVAARGRAMAAAAPGGMLAVTASAGTVAPFLRGESTVSAENSPSSVVIGGPRDQLADLAARLEAAGIESVALRVNHAFHTAAMDPVLPALRAALDTAARPAANGIRLVSNVTGEVVPTGTRISPGYWTDHLRQPVRFATGLARVLALPRPVLVEVGPGSALTSFAHQQVGAASLMAVPTLPAPGGPDTTGALLEAVGLLWTHGVPVDLGRVNVGRSGRRIPLPDYPFDHERYWIEPAPRGPVKAAPASPEPTARTPAPLGPEVPDPTTLVPVALEPVGGRVRDSAVRDRAAEGLERIWRDLLGVESVAGGTNFYAVGGHSLLAVRLLARVRTVFGIDLSLSTVLQAPTFGAMSGVLRDALDGDPKTRDAHSHEGIPRS